MRIERVAHALSTIQKIAFLTLDEYTMIALSSAIEVLRMANRLSGQQHTHGRCSRSTASRCLRAMIGLCRCCPYDAADDLDMVLVCGGTNVTKFVDDKVINLLRRMARDGVVLGGLCTGTYALSKLVFWTVTNARYIGKTWPAFASFIRGSSSRKSYSSSIVIG